MKPHLTPIQIRSLATRYVASRSDPSARVRLPAHLHRCDRCHEAFTEDLGALAWLRTAAAEAPVRLTPRRPRPTPPRHRRLHARRPAVRAVLCMLAVLAAMTMTPRQSGDAAGVPLTPVMTKAGMPSDAQQTPLENAVAQPPVLRLADLPSAAFAIRRAKIRSTDQARIRLSASRFIEDVLPRLDPVDQWRVHQTALAALGFYPSEHVDGLYGKRTKAALREFLDENEQDARPELRRGLLAKHTATELFAQFGDVLLAFTESPAYTAHSEGAPGSRRTPPSPPPRAGATMTAPAH